MKVTGDLTARTGFKDTIPTAFGYIGIGVAFGIIGQSNHLSVLEILLMSLITYAGSAQFVIVSMVALHANILSIVLSVFFGELADDSNEHSDCTLYEEGKYGAEHLDRHLTDG